MKILSTWSISSTLQGSRKFAPKLVTVYWHAQSSIRRKTLPQFLPRMFQSLRNKRWQTVTYSLFFAVDHKVLPRICVTCDPNLIM